MARPLRIEFPDEIGHLTSRGNARQAIWGVAGTRRQHRSREDKSLQDDPDRHMPDRITHRLLDAKHRPSLRQFQIGKQK